MATQPQTPEPGRHDQSRARVGRPAAGRGLTKGTSILLLVGVIAVVLVGMYYPTIKTFLYLQPWSKSGPRAAVDRYTEALNANDVAAARAAGAKDALQINVEGRRIVSVKPTVQMNRPPLDVAQVQPAVSATGAPVEYDFREMRACARITVPTLSGGRVQFELIRERGEWRIRTFNVLGAL